MAADSFSAVPQEQESKVPQEEFYSLGLESNTVLRDYQLAGANWIIDCYNNNHGCILGDEMGLGKTIQSIVYLLYLRSKLSTYSFLVVCPLSLVQNWQREIETFAPDFNVISLVGDKEFRQETLSQIIHSNSLDSVVITTPEYVLIESALSKLKWSCMVFDEAHKLKNHESKLYNKIQTCYTIQFLLLVTGTPIQNNLRELYALLALIHHKNFPLSRMDNFVSQFQTIAETDNKEDINELYSILKPYILRRTKQEVYTPISDIQKNPPSLLEEIPTISTQDGSKEDDEIV